MTIKVKSFELSEYLNSPEAISAYLEAALDEGDPSFFMSALTDVVNIVGVAKVANNAGLAPEYLSNILTPGAFPSFDTVQKLIKALRVTLITKPLR